ncbi:MAG: metallophosphoesterase [Paludibacteraceae bacterium]|nr:metallophosphoesterase [Paludibacteraceae bacterium]
MEEQKEKKLRHSTTQVDDAIDRLEEICDSGGIKPDAIPSGAITGPKIGPNAVTTGKIAPGTIIESDINSSAFDDNLQKKGKLADAKVVGDAIRNLQEVIDGVAGAVSGFKTVGSVSDLPALPTAQQQTIGWIIGTHLYVYVGTGGNALDGKYKDVGEFKGPKGADGKDGDKGDKGDPGEQGPVGPAGDTTAVEAYMKQIRDAIAALPAGSTTTDAKVIKNEADINDLAQKLSELKSILRMISQDGFAVSDKDGNVGMKYDENGLDAAKLSSHLIALIQAVVKVSSSLIAEIEQRVWAVTDGDGYAGMTYGEDGLDFAKISQHAIDVLNEAGIASKIVLDNYVTADGQNAVVGSAIFSAISAVTAVANEAVTLSEQAKTDAKNAKDAIATLQGLSDATEAARTLAALTSQIQQNTQDVNALKTADANLGVIGQYCQEQVYLIKYALNSTRLGNNRFSFVYTADNHGGSIGYADVVADNTAAKCVVIGGDMLGGYWGSDATNRQKDWKRTKDQILAMTKPCFYAMGNHDVTGSTNIAERYNFFYNDSEINAHNGVSPQHTYFNVDYPTVKLIVLDFYDVENQSSETQGMSKGQIDWFIAQLEDAASKNLHVVCVAHHSPDESKYTYKNMKNCEYVKSWTDGNGSSVKALSILSSLVESFKGASSYNLTYDGNTFSGTFSNAGHFVCWLGGHGHLDFLGWLTNYPEQIYYDSTRPGIGGSNTHLVEGKTYSSVCYITVDTNVQKVTFMKVGSDRDYFGTKRDIITLDYK